MQKYALVTTGGAIVSRIDPATSLAMPSQWKSMMFCSSGIYPGLVWV